MNGHNLKLALRRIARNYKLTLLVFIGLAIGLTSCLIIYIKVNYELSFDNFHTRSKDTYRVVRVTSGLDYLGGGLEYRTGVLYPLPGEIKKSVPELQDVAAMLYLYGQKISIPARENNKEKTFTLDNGVVFTEPSFFNIFDFGKKGIKWLNGEGKQVLERPFTTVLTKETAEKLFPDQDPMGQEIDVNGTRFTVAGVISDFPKNTDFPFKVILSLVTFSEKIAAEYFNRWEPQNDSYECYVVLNKKSDIASIEQKFKDIHAMHRPAGDVIVEQRLFKLQPLSQVHKDSQLGNFNNHTVSGGLLLSITLVGIFIFLIACFNYSNFFLAETFKQKKQIALKLILGSKPLSIFFQFFAESMLVTFCALIVSVLAATAIIKNFFSVIDIPQGYFPEIGPADLIFILVLLFTAGILSVVFSYFNLHLKSLSSLLKKTDSENSGKGNLFGKWSVILQFVVAQTVIIATLMIVKQIYYINNKDLGYDTENIIVAGLPENSQSKLNSLSGELRTNPAIKGVSFSFFTPAEKGGVTFFNVFRNNEEIGIAAQFKYIDTSYLNLYSLKLLTGQNLSINDTAFNVLVNREFVKEIGVTNLNDAIGTRIKSYWGDAILIKGVVEDFYSGSMHDKIRPCVLLNFPSGYGTLNIKLANSGIKKRGRTEALPGDIAKINDVWTKIFPDEAFEYTFLSDTIDNYYKSEHNALSLFLLFASVTIFLCVLGILGLSLSTNERKIKEIGIRKVNGARVDEIMFLLNKNFVIWVAIAFIVAAPVAWYAMYKWLESFAYKTSLSWWIFALSGILALTIVLLTVSWQSWWAATRNPVEALRYE